MLKLLKSSCLPVALGTRARPVFDCMTSRLTQQKTNGFGRFKTSRSETHPVDVSCGQTKSDLDVVRGFGATDYLYVHDLSIWDRRSPQALKDLIVNRVQ